MPEHLSTGITIDPPGSPDRDDAIWIERTSVGWLASVSIADVARAVPRGSSVDLAAFERGATVYDLGGTEHRHMLPYHLVEAELSLNASGRRQALNFRFEITRQGNVRLLSIEQAPVKILSNLNWGDFAAIAEADPAFARWYELGRLLRAQRRVPLSSQRYQRYGSRLIELSVPGRLPQIHSALKAVGLVEELMILTNHTVAALLVKDGVPFLLRTHGPAELKEKFGSDQRSSAKVVRFQKSFPRAVYEPVDSWHHGLNLAQYAHLTSPIRRYADLVNQRILVAYIAGLPLPYSQDELRTIGAHLTNRTTRIEAQYRLHEREEARRMRPTA